MDPAHADVLWEGPARDGADGRFDAVREQHVKVNPAPKRGRDLWYACDFECKRGERKAATECASCSHFLNLVPDADGGGATLRCVFFDDDPVSAIMTSLDQIVTVPSGASSEESLARAASRGVKVLVVTTNDEVVGLSSPPHRRRTRLVPVVPMETPLAAVARLFRERRAHCLLIVDGAEVVGLVTAGDLRRAGIPWRFLGRAP